MIRTNAMYSLRRVILHSAIALGLAAGGLSHAAEQEKVRLYTENFPPYNMAIGTENYAHNPEDITGFATVIVKALFARLDIPYSMKLRSWTRAFGLAKRKPGYAVFSTTRTPEREDEFKWVGPIAQNNWTIFAQTSKQLKVASIDDLKSYKVGGYTGDSITLFLLDNGVDISTIERDSLNVSRLQTGQIDLWASNHIAAPYYAKEQNVSDLESIFTIKENDLYIAFNKDTDQELVDRLNAEMKAMREEGFIEKVIAAYTE